MSSLFTKCGPGAYLIPDPAGKVESVLGVHPYEGGWTDVEQAPAGEPDDEDLRARIIAALCVEIEQHEAALRLLLSSAVPVTADPVEYRVETQPVNERPVLFYKISVEDWDKVMAMPGVQQAMGEG